MLKKVILNQNGLRGFAKAMPPGFYYEQIWQFDIFRNSRDSKYICKNRGGPYGACFEISA